MEINKIDLVCLQGAKFAQQFIWKDQAGDEINLTGYTARMHLRASVADDAVVMSLTTANNRITLGGAAGTIDLEISAVDTALFDIAHEKTKWRYDLELLPGGVEADAIRFCQGSFTVLPEVTRV